MKKIVIIFILLTHTVLAAELCEHIDKVCLKKLKQNLLDLKDEALIQKVINKHGYSFLFLPTDRSGKTLMGMLPFTGHLELFEDLSSNGEFLESIPKGKNLYDFFLNIYKSAKFDHKFFSKDEVKLLFILLNSKSNEFLFHDWGNPNYPTVYSKIFKKYLKSIIRVEKDTDPELKLLAKGLISKLERLEKFTSKICYISDIEKYREYEEKYDDFVQHTEKGKTLLDCLKDKRKYKLLSYIIESEKFEYEQLSPILKSLWSKRSESALKLYQDIIAKMIDSQDLESVFTMYPFSKYHQFISEKNRCIQLEILGKKSIKSNVLDNCDELLFQEVIDKLVFAKMDYSKHGKEWMNQLDEIVDIYKKGFNYDYQDENGDTLVHHLVDTNIRDLVIYVEQKLNTKKKSLSYLHKNNDGHTPLHIAIGNKNLALISDYTADNVTIDHKRFPFRSIKKLKNIQNKYNEKNQDIVKRIPAQSVKEKIIRNSIIERMKGH